MEEVAELCLSINTKLGEIDPASSTAEEMKPLEVNTEALLKALDGIDSSRLDVQSPHTETLQTALSTIVTLLQLYVHDANAFYSVVMLVWKHYGSLIRKYACIMEESYAEELHTIFTMSCTDGLNHILHCSDEEETRGALKVLILLTQRLAITLGYLRSVSNQQVRVDAYAVLIGVYGFVRMYDKASGRSSSSHQQNLLQSVKKVLRPFTTANNSNSPPSTAQDSNSQDHIVVLDLTLLFSSFEAVMLSMTSCGFAPAVLVGAIQVLLDSLSSPSIPDAEKSKELKYIINAIVVLSLSFESQFHGLCLQDMQLLGMRIMQQASVSPSLLDSVILRACGLVNSSHRDHPLITAMIVTARTVLVSLIINCISNDNDEIVQYCMRAVILLFNRALANEKSCRSYLEHATEVIVCLLCHPSTQHCIFNTIMTTIREVTGDSRKRKLNHDKIIIPWPLLEHVVKNLPLLSLLNSDNQQVQNDIKYMIWRALDDLQGPVLSYEKQAVSYCLVANITSTTVNNSNGIINPFLDEIVRSFVSNKEISTKTLQLLRTLTAQLELYAKEEHLLIVNIQKITSWAAQITTLMMTFLAYQLPKGVQKIIAECMSRSSACLKAIVNVPVAKENASFQFATSMLAHLVVTTFDLLSRSTVDSGCEQEIIFALKAFAEAKSSASNNNAWQAVEIYLVELAHRSDWAHQQIMAHIGYAEMQRMIDTTEAINKQRLQFSTEEIQENLFDES